MAQPPYQGSLDAQFGAEAGVEAEMPEGNSPRAPPSPPPAYFPPPDQLQGLQRFALVQVGNDGQNGQGEDDDEGASSIQIQISTASSPTGLPRESPISIQHGKRPATATRAENDDDVDDVDEADEFDDFDDVDPIPEDPAISPSRMVSADDYAEILRNSS